MFKRLLILLLPFVFIITPIAANAASLSSGWYTIQPQKSAVLRLNIDDTKIDTQLKLKNAANKTGQKFYIQQQSDGTYKIGTGTTIGMSAITSGETQQKYVSSNKKQKWNIISNADGSWQIVNASTNKALSYSSLTDGNLLSETTKSTVDTQKFLIKPFDESYTVTFVDGLGNTLKRQSVKKNGSATAPNITPTKAGYTFSGWNKSFNKITSNLTVTAQFTLNDYEQNYTKKADNGTTVWYTKTNKVLYFKRAGADVLDKATATSMAKRFSASCAINAGTWDMSGDLIGYPRGFTAFNDTIIYDMANGKNEECLALKWNGKLVSENVSTNNKTIKVNGRIVKFTAYDSSIYKWVLKGNYVLMEDGKRKNTTENPYQTSPTQISPYSFICQDTDGYYYLAATGGRGNDGEGMTHDDIYNFALNKMSKKINFIYLLDSGGSVSYVLNNKLINKPTAIKGTGDNQKMIVEERKIPNIIMIE